MMSAAEYSDRHNHHRQPRQITGHWHDHTYVLGSVADCPDCTPQEEV